MSFIFSSIALFIMLSIESSLELNDSRPGVVNNLLNFMANIFSEKRPVSTEPEIWAIGIFPLVEQEERAFVIYVAIMLCILSLFFAFVAKIKSEFSLFSAVAVFSTFTALTVWNHYVASLYGVVALVCAINYRKCMKNNVE